MALGELGGFPCSLSPLESSEGQGHLLSSMFSIAYIFLKFSLPVGACSVLPVSFSLCPTVPHCFAASPGLWNNSGTSGF